MTQRRHTQLWGVFKHEGRIVCTEHQTILLTQLHKQIWVDLLLLHGSLLCCYTHAKTCKYLVLKAMNLPHACTEIQQESA